MMQTKPHMPDIFDGAAVEDYTHPYALARIRQEKASPHRSSPATNHYTTVRLHRQTTSK
jgi:hypothetical protein